MPDPSLKAGQQSGRGRGRSQAGPWRLFGLVVLTLALVLAAQGCIEIDNMYKSVKSSVEADTVSLEGIESVEMKLGAADIKVVSQETSEGTFTIQKMARASDEEEGEKLLAQAVVAIRREGSKIVLEREESVRKSVSVSFKGYVSIDVTAILPAGLALDIFTGSGDIEIDTRTGAVAVRTGSGDITVTAAGGGLEATTGSGDVEVHAGSGGIKLSSGSGNLFLGVVEGEVRAVSGSGDISIDSITGEMDVHSGSGDISVNKSAGGAVVGTSSGDIELDDHAGSANLSASSGDIEVALGVGEGELVLKTSSGNVDVTLENAASVELDIATTSGSISTHVPIVVKEATRRRLHGMSGDGDLRVSIITASGDVTVGRRSI